MNSLSVKEIQHESLEILKEIHSFCEKNGIMYSVIGGTLLGAIRHKGFIPWDDDVDVMMPRDEYERFCTSFHSERYKLLSWHNDRSCKIAYAKVCEMKNTLVKDQAWTSENVGIWVDVFPFDGAENDYNSFKQHYSDIRNIWTSLYYNRALGGKPGSHNNAKLNFAIKTLRAFHLSGLNNMLARRKIRNINKRAQLISYGESDFVSQFAFLEPGIKEYFELKAFQKTDLVPFEDTIVRAISGYDHYLTRFYGDYMKLPPEKDRVPKHEDSGIVWR